MDTDQQVRRLLDTYTSAVLAKNVQTLMHLYDPQVRVFDAWGLWSYEGAEAWRVAVEGWFTSLGSETVRVRFEDVKIISSADMALMSAVVAYTGCSADGQELRSMHNRISWGLKTSGHVLRVVHEHTSAPIGFDDQKAILQRAAR